MTQAQHLPAPWEIEARGDDSRISTRDGRTVAIVPWDSDTLETHQATVALIAAAPAMLAALERVRDYLQHPKTGSIPAGASLVAVLEAIAQAKGGQV